MYLDGYLDLISARIARQHAAKRASASAATTTPRHRAPTVSDEAFERMRAAIEGRTPAASTAKQNDEAAAAAILSAFRELESATSEKPTPAGRTTPEDEAAVAAIMGVFRTLSASR